MNEVWDLRVLVPAERMVVARALGDCPGWGTREAFARTPEELAALQRLATRTRRRAPIFITGDQVFFRIDPDALKTYLASKQPKRRRAS